MEKVQDVLRTSGVRHTRWNLLGFLPATIDRELSPSPRSVKSRLDYGIRAPDSQLTDEMMYPGKTVSVSVASQAAVLTPDHAVGR
jgi:hypothetical protein